jgi:hypothetical protein
MNAVHRRGVADGFCTPRYFAVKRYVEPPLRWR